MGENLTKKQTNNLIFEIDNFSGPLDLLLKLIQAQKIDINDIPIVQITSQFLEFIKKYENQLFDRLGDYLVMASKLTLIKAKMLLPNQEEALDEISDPRENLKNQLLAYDKFVKIGEALKQQKSKHQLNYSREEIFASEWQRPALKKGAVSLEQLVNCMQRIMIHQSEREEVFNIVKRLNISLSDVASCLKGLLRHHKRVSFSQLIREFPSLDGVIACFVEILSLMHDRQLKVSQINEFGELFLEQNYGL